MVGCDVIQDRGYDSNKNRPNLESQNNITVIPGRKNRKTEIVYDREKYKLRGAIERFFGKIKEN
ncbi:MULTISPECIES: transposase [unclassified Candidatus Tisiphia]|uniref:transposase n=1 Tax=unclassified Candidatus Tisiphia TaxID=2996318 RepID=UPI0035C9328C